ncbi:MAG: glyceraldehyde 3-phosphate dehydrogenase NAD-binding domain-containing protein, partial [Patescibacteria group bacterium]
MIKVAINGFGRIGRLFLRQAIRRPEFSIVAINDLGDVENLAYLFKYDTIYGRIANEIRGDTATNEIIIGEQRIKVLQVKDPTQLP